MLFDHVCNYFLVFLVKCLPLLVDLGQLLLQTKHQLLITDYHQISEK